MPKILSKSGDSLADVYDIAGSIAGIDNLESQDVSLVHEMGATIFAERQGSHLFHIVTGALAQDINFDVELVADLQYPARVHAIIVFANAVRLAHWNISVHQEITGRDVPIAIFDSANDKAFSGRLQDNGAASANRTFFRPGQTFLPTLLSGPDQPNVVDRLFWRGRTSGFGAGTVSCICVVHISFPHQEGISSRGLPMPSW